MTYTTLGYFLLTFFLLVTFFGFDLDVLGVVFFVSVFKDFSGFAFFCSCVLFSD
jgi:hypothetical protein